VAESVSGEEAVDVRDGEVERVGDELVILSDLDAVGSWPPPRLPLHPPHIRSNITGSRMPADRTGGGEVDAEESRSGSAAERSGVGKLEEV